jgi:hypothetical protein
MISESEIVSFSFKYFSTIFIFTIFIFQISATPRTGKTPSELIAISETSRRKRKLDEVINDMQGSSKKFDDFF